METYGDLLTRLRVRLDEITAHRWLDVPLLQKLYDGAKDVSRKSESIRVAAVVTAVPEQQQYTLADGVPADIVRIHRVTYSPLHEDRIVPLDYYDFMSADAIWWTQQSVAIQTPAIYTTWGAPPNLTLVAYPTPPDAGAFTIYYYKMPLGPFVDADGDAIEALADQKAVVCELPQGWEDCAVDYACYMALLEDRDPLWQTHKALYEEHMSDLTITATRFNDQAGIIVPDSGFGGVPRFIWDENY